MSSPHFQAPHKGGVPTNSPTAPNAALLIDFDNVTMGMRSDLSKELNTLLNSDIIKGKVTVQRAYADWRRYPQYIVPLSENSVDLIFAPAYGSSKKNATDIRMAIDGMELIFLRPEIGTYILLTGDSDFSSLVLKLKEYGKYVIGVGIQESSSDILVQNCDEYYSYTSLTGLRKTTEASDKAMDPWVLVEKAVERMASRNDVMRSDRLKQVMIEMDPSFDEGNFGFSKFSKFLSEASSRNLVKLRKLENGQYEVKPSRNGGGGEGPRARAETGREGRGRPRPQKGREPAAEKKGPRPGEKERERPAEKAAPGPVKEEAPAAQEGDPLQAAYDLMRRSLTELTSGSEGSVRDSDLKRKMLEVNPSFDEGELGFGKFSRFLRQAHDHEVVDLEKREEGTYQVSPRGPEAGAAREEEVREAPGRVKEETGEEPAKELEERPAKEPAAAAASTRPSETRGGSVGLRLRRGGKSGGKKGEEGPPPLLEGQVVAPGEKTEVTAPSAETPPTPSAPPAPQEPSGQASREEMEPGALGLPTDRTAMIRYLSNSYKGVGEKTAEKVVEAFGDDLYDVLQKEPDRLSSVIPTNRADQLLEGWKTDFQRRLQRAYEEEKKGEEKGGKKEQKEQKAEKAEKKEKSQSRDPSGSGNGKSRSSSSGRRTRKSGRSRTRR